MARILPPAMFALICLGNLARVVAYRTEDKCPPCSCPPCKHTPHHVATMVEYAGVMSTLAFAWVIACGTAPTFAQNLPMAVVASLAAAAPFVCIMLVAHTLTPLSVVLTIVVSVLAFLALAVVLAATDLPHIVRVLQRRMNQWLSAFRGNGASGRKVPRSHMQLLTYDDLAEHDRRLHDATYDVFDTLRGLHGRAREEAFAAVLQRYDIAPQAVAYGYVDSDAKLKKTSGALADFMAVLHQYFMS